MTGLKKAIDRVGNASELARLIGIAPISVSRWKTRQNSRVPANRVMQIFNLTGVTPHDLRPDLYPNPTDGLPSKEA